MLELTKSVKRQHLDVPFDMGAVGLLTPIETFDSIGLLGGMEVHERRNPDIDNAYGYRCSEFAFSKITQTPLAGWIGKLGENLMPRLWNGETLDFLLSVGFESVDELEVNVLVIYGNAARLSNDIVRRHYAVGLDGGLVISKWSIGHVYRHPLNNVPPSYGNTAWFMKLRDKDLALAKLL
jgi:hypothetical protein